MDQIANTSSRSAKEALLRDADKPTKLALQAALDPFRTYGITMDKKTVLRQQGGIIRTGMASVWWEGFHLILDKLAARHLTGNEANYALTAHLTVAPSPTDATWALRVVNKDLRCGVSVKTLTKVFPGLVVPFEVALAKPWEPEKHTLQGIGYLEPKLDGERVTVVDGIARTRNGNVVSATDAMLDELASIVGRQNGRRHLRDWVFDGEFIGSGTFEETMSAARKSGSENRGLIYNVFDMVSRDEWTARTTRPFSDRRRDVERYIAKGGQFVHRVESVRVEDPSPSDVMRFRDQWLAAGFEGAMYKADQPYQFKRSTALLKIKKWETVDAKIVGVETGTGKYEGLLGALVIQLGDGTKVNVGSGYTDAQREDIWINQQRTVGRTIEVQYQNKTSKGSLRFPVFVRFRDDLA
jgi:DNA ligase-1